MMKIFILRLYIMDLTGSCYDDQHLAKTIFAYDLLHGYNANGYDLISIDFVINVYTKDI